MTCAMRMLGKQGKTDDTKKLFFLASRSEVKEVVIVGKEGNTYPV